MAVSILSVSNGHALAWAEEVPIIFRPFRDNRYAEHLLRKETLCSGPSLVGKSSCFLVQHVAL
jgi:hypothetical protein